MRAFIAVDMPKEVKDHLFSLYKKVKNAKVNWVHKKNLHLTMAFIGEISEEKLEELQAKLKQIEFKPIKAHISKLGFFPSKDHIKLIWVGLEPTEQITELQHLIDQETIGLTHNEQKFVSHVTLGRIKSIKNMDKFKESLKELEVEQIEFTINSFELIKSDLKRTGPTYTLIEKYEALS